MHILEMTLHRDKRFGFSGLETIKYTPTLDVQIIIGTNGSGKSSFMDELSPLPPEPSNMLPGGYKDIRIRSTDGFVYHLLSKFGKQNKHSFCRVEADGTETEMNTGGTQTAQKVLIERIFNVNTEIIKILIGRINFTDMPPMKRRDWILKLSDNDLTYAMKLFNAVRNGHRDATALEKHHTRRLSEESSDLTNKERIVELERVVTMTAEAINEIMLARENNIPQVNAVMFKIQDNIRRFNDQAAELMTLHLVKPTCLIGVSNNIPAVKEFIAQHKTKQEMYFDQLKVLYADKDKVLDTVNALERTGVQGIDELNKITKDITLKIQQLRSEVVNYDSLKGRDIGQALGSVKAVKPVLIELLSKMTDNSQGIYSKSKVNATKERISNLNLIINADTRKGMEYEHQLKHYGQADSAECPKCSHQFKPGMGEFNPEQTKEDLGKLNLRLVELEKERDELTEYMDAVRAYSAEIKTVRMVMDNNPDLDILWHLLQDQELFRVVPTTHIPTIEAFEQDIAACNELAELEDKLEVNQMVIENVRQLSGGAGDLNSVDYLNQLDTRIDALLNAMQGNADVLAKTEHFLKEITKATDANTEMLRLRESLISDYDLLLSSMKNKALAEVLQQKQVQLANTQNTLNQISRHEAVIEELEREKGKATDNVKHLNIIMKALSPVDGLISKYIQNFIDVFIEDINIVIAEVWSTPLEVLSCGVDSTDVTCKFPLSSNNGYLITPDISHSSNGQQDIINLAFRIAVVKYLGLTDVPLYLDELAPTLDEQHRENITRFITRLMEDKIYNQMFMISHYASNHYAFPNAEIFMVDGRNIVNKPKEYNSHVELTYRSDLAA